VDLFERMTGPVDVEGPAANEVHLGDNLEVLATIPDASVDLVYIDPPFNTGRTQRRARMVAVLDEEGDRMGFGGRRYRTEKVEAGGAFRDSFEDYLGFLEPRIREAHRVLKPSGSFYFHIDPRESHYCKILIDKIFSRDHFLNEIIWAYDYGARSTRRWPSKHDTIFWYAKDIEAYHFDTSEVDRLPYMAPTLVGEEKARRGKLPTDVWWHTIVSPTGQEKLGYPTQKPLGILKRIVASSCPVGGLVLDFFAGSGTTGAAALATGRRFLLVDDNPEAFAVMQRRFAGVPGVRFVDGSKVGSAELSGNREPAEPDRGRARGARARKR
jgi:site-specific DNA-methyltransferase (adenine-specific)